MFCMQSKKMFLRVRVQFVQCRDALMQIFVRLDRDKNSSVGTASALVASKKRPTFRLCFHFVCYEGYQSGLQVRRELRWDLFYFLVLFFQRLTVRLFVKKTTNQACEWGETYGQTCFIFLLLFSWPTLGLKKKKFCFRN